MLICKPWLLLRNQNATARYLGEDGGVVGRLILFFLVSCSLLHLLSVRFLFPVCTFRLKNKLDDFIHRAEDGQLTSKTGP